MANVLDADRINRLIGVCRSKVEQLSSEEAAELDNSMAIEFDEHFKFQQLQASYHAMGMLTPEAAQVVYVALGEIGSTKNGGWAANTDTATKVIVTQLMAELLKLEIARRSTQKVI